LSGYNGQRRRDRILSAAERLFSEAGIDGVSMREIAAEAGVQLALISYYFGTKQELYRAVFRRRIEPVSKERLQMLQRILDRTRAE
jgi:AcrR family transcriptional regulator